MDFCGSCASYRSFSNTVESVDLRPNRSLWCKFGVFIRPTVYTSRNRQKGEEKCSFACTSVRITHTELLPLHLLLSSRDNSPGKVHPRLVLTAINAGFVSSHCTWLDFGGNFPIWSDPMRKLTPCLNSMPGKAMASASGFPSVTRRCGSVLPFGASATSSQMQGTTMASTSGDVLSCSLRRVALTTLSFFLGPPDRSKALMARSASPVAVAAMGRSRHPCPKRM